MCKRQTLLRSFAGATSSLTAGEKLPGIYCLGLITLKNLDLSGFVLPEDCIERIVTNNWHVHIWGVANYGMTNNRIHKGKYEYPDSKDDFIVSEDMDSPGVTTRDSHNLPRQRDWYWVSSSEL